MNSDDQNLTTILNHALDHATQNLTFDKLLIQVGLDPNNVTLHAIFVRLIEIASADLNFANMCALIGAGFYAATLLMRTMVPLRVFGIISALFFVAYGALAGAMSTFFMYLLLLPLNSWRLFQMRGLVKKARVAAQGDLSMDWLKPFMNRRIYRRGDVLFRKGQTANEMFLTVTGKFLVREIGVELPPGRLVGELGFVTPNNRRTQTVECIESGEVLTITYDRLLEIYFDNPEFGYFFLRLASDRLLQNIARLEGIIAAGAGMADATAPVPPAELRAPSDGPSGDELEIMRAMETIDVAEPVKDASTATAKVTLPDVIVPPADASACRCGETGRTLCFMVRGCRNYSAAVRRSGGSRQRAGSHAPAYFTDLRCPVFRKPRQGAHRQPGRLDDPGEQRHGRRQHHQERAGRRDGGERSGDASLVRRGDLRHRDGFHSALCFRRNAD